MTLVDSSGAMTSSARRRKAPALGGLILIAALVTFMAALIDRVTVTGQGGLDRVMFGYPLGWLAQNQSAMDPPFPVGVSPASPWENPTSVAIGPMILDFAIVFAVLVACWLIGRGVLRKITSAAH